MKINVQFWLHRSGEKTLFAYGAVSVRGKLTYAKVNVAVQKAFGSMGDVGLHSWGEGSSLNRVGKITLMVDPDETRTLILTPKIPGKQPCS
jgi:hypothetical protein